MQVSLKVKYDFIIEIIIFTVITCSKILKNPLSRNLNSESPNDVIYGMYNIEVYKSYLININLPIIWKSPTEF